MAGEGAEVSGTVKPARRKSLLPLATPALMLCLAATTAQGGLALCGEVVAVTPTRIPLSMAPGEEHRVEVELINQGDVEVTLLPEVLLVREGEGGETVLAVDEICSWVIPGKERIALLPGARERCPFTVRVPEDADRGTHRFALSFQPFKGENEGVGFSGGVAVLAEIEVLAAEGGGTGGEDRFPLGVLAAALAGALLVSATSLALFLARGRGKRAEQGGEGEP